MTKTNKNEPQYILGLIVLAILIFISIKCHGQRTTAVVDTIPCKIECIHKFITEPTKSGGERIYAVYNDIRNDVSDLIPVSQSVYKYIKLCELNAIKPKLGIRLRNGQITSIVKYKQHYEVNTRPNYTAKK